MGTIKFSKLFIAIFIILSKIQMQNRNMFYSYIAFFDQHIYFEFFSRFFLLLSDNSRWIIYSSVSYISFIIDCDVLQITSSRHRHQKTHVRESTNEKIVRLLGFASRVDYPIADAIGIPSWSLSWQGRRTNLETRFSGWIPRWLFRRGDVAVWSHGMYNSNYPGLRLK